MDPGCFKGRVEALGSLKPTYTYGWGVLQFQLAEEGERIQSEGDGGSRAVLRE